MVQGAASSVPEAVGSDSPGSRCAAPGGVRSCSVGCKGSPGLGVWVLLQGWGQPRGLRVPVGSGCGVGGPERRAAVGQA